MKKENGWPIFYIVRFTNERMALHSYRIDREKREYVISDKPGYAVDISKGLIMAEHSELVRNAVLMAERLFRGNVKENVEAYHWYGDEKPDGSVSIDEACDSIEGMLDVVTDGGYSKGWEPEVKYGDMDHEAYLKYIEEAIKAGPTPWSDRKDKYHNEMAYIGGGITRIVRNSRGDAESRRLLLLASESMRI